jgi:hypothetical protein
MLMDLGVPTITAAIETLVEWYRVEYGIDAYHINCGACEDFANAIVNSVPGAVAGWGDEFCALGEEDFDRFGYHCVIRYRGRFYDSQHPNGVSDFRKISAFG